jgi:lysyl-tRNA synthetase class 2
MAGVVPQTCWRVISSGGVRRPSAGSRWRCRGSAIRPDFGAQDISGEWPVITVHDAVSNALGESVSPATALPDLRPLDAGVPVGDQSGPRRHGPDSVRRPGGADHTDYPTDVSPLTRRHRRDPRLAERWDLIAFGAEIGTADAERTDPVEQRRRLETQSLRAASGDVEATELDGDFLLALEHGMPPTGGLGLGIDRLLMMLTRSTIRRTILYPFARPGRS